ncbi:MAG: hypothetical protein IPK50_01685 [Fibrobacterota bacterium]|nr:hypothetical protein [Fibrobacterota bacterium]QQS05613.1 MAG: hypothetical protein IPK50_01685 [Fibrobacterota bacterium]
MKKTQAVALHVVAGTPLPAPISESKTSVLRLPGGTTTTRWLTRGVSISGGWGTALERELNRDLSVGAHCVLDLSLEGIDLEGLTDELHPLWDRGLPRIRTALDEARIQLAALGCHPTPGTLLLDLHHPPAADRLKKLTAWCKRNDLFLLVRSSTQSGQALGVREVALQTSLADLSRQFLSGTGPA